jgi:hypothetical protein
MTKTKTITKRRKAKAKPKPQIDPVLLSRWLRRKGACESTRRVVLHSLRRGKPLLEIWKYSWLEDQLWLARTLGILGWWDETPPNYAGVLRALRAALKPRRRRRLPPLTGETEIAS